ncbi:MAG TPA: CvpA family protein [Patescibacteria group bacterium]
MTLVDVIILIIIFGFVLYGFWFGLIHTIGALLGLVVGSYVAGFSFDIVADSIDFIFGGNTNLARLVSFILILAITRRLVGFLFVFVEKIFKFLQIIPLVKTANRIAGAAIGLLEGIIVISLVLYLASQYPITPFIEQLLTGSWVAQVFIVLAELFVPILPAAFRGA